MTHLLYFPFAVATVLTVTTTATSATPQEDEFFKANIHSIFVQKCSPCHGKQKLAGLNLTTAEGFFKGADTGPVFSKNDPHNSHLLTVIRYEGKVKMPPDGRLSDKEIETLTAWIKLGAPWPGADPEAKTMVPTIDLQRAKKQERHWSFQPIQDYEPPSISGDWMQSPIDKFILAKLREKGLKAGKRADKVTLIRRATFDLTGLPPTPEEISTFLVDSSPDAFSKVVDRLLASPRYGERWGRHWLDVARYTDQEVRTEKGYSSAWRYRDWVIEAFNQDMPYDQFIKAQIAADLISEKKDSRLLPALGFISLGTWVYQGDIPYVVARADELEDRLDVLTRGFLGLTVACARCHDHKYDPISQKDYYALAGVFASTDYQQYFLASDETVTKYEKHQAKVQDKKDEIQMFLEDVNNKLQISMAKQTSRYLMATRKLHNDLSLTPSQVAQEDNLDQESLKRWGHYLDEDKRDHTYLHGWDTLATKNGTDTEAKTLAEEFQKKLFLLLEEKKAVADENETIKNTLHFESNVTKTFKPDGKFYYDQCSSCEMRFRALDRDKFYLWADLFRRSTTIPGETFEKPLGVFEYQGEALMRFLLPAQKAKYDLLEAELKDLEKSSEEPAYIMAMMDSPTPKNMRINIRGNVYNLGDEIPRGLPSVVGNVDGELLSSDQGSGRLALAEAIVRHPLTPRVMVNRIWTHHFGRGIVATPSNFGQTGERPTHAKLLDHLATQLLRHKWSVKAIHREIMLSRTYQLSSEVMETNNKIDAENRFFSRANRIRLSAEALRDTLLFVSGNLNMETGGPSRPLSVDNNRRTVYRKVNRATADPLMALFDFPDPTLTSAQRSTTTVPLQGLFFLNSDLILQQAQLLAERLFSHGNGDDAARIKYAYPLLYGREATETEIRLGLNFLSHGQTKSEINTVESGSASSRWQQYSQVLLASSEFYFID